MNLLLCLALTASAQSWNAVARRAAPRVSALPAPTPKIRNLQVFLAQPRFNKAVIPYLPADLRRPEAFLRLAPRGQIAALSSAVDAAVKDRAIDLARAMPGSPASEQGLAFDGSLRRRTASFAPLSAASARLAPSLGRRKLSASYRYEGGPVKVAFFDADSTLRVSLSGSVSASGPKDVMLLPWIEKRIADLARQGYLIAIVSNQAGIPRHVSLENADRALAYTAELIRKAGGEVHYYDFADKKNDDRKPGTGMFARLEASLQQRFGAEAKIDRAASLMVGDSAYKPGDVRPDGEPGAHFSNADRLFAENAGIAFHEPTDFFGWRKHGIDVFQKAAEVEAFRKARPLPDLSQSVRLIADQAYLAQAVGLIRSAKTSLDVLAYSARYGGAAQKILDELIDAKRAAPALRARVFMEGARDTSAANRETAKRLEAAGVEVLFGDTHAKAIIADGRAALVGSTNLTQTSIGLNNETNALIDDEEAAAALAAYFEKLWNDPKARDPRAVSLRGGDLKVVTDSAYRQELLDMIRTSARSLDLSVYYLQLMGDDGKVRPDMADLAQALIDAKARKVELRIFLEQNGGPFAPHITEGNRRSAEYLRSQGIPVYFDRPDQISHSKYVVKDGEEILLGTGNFNPADFSRHRQLFLRVKDASIARRLAAHHSAKLAYSADRPKARRPYFRFWLGWVKPGLALEDFDRTIDRVFIDATIKTGQKRGLHAYLPALTRQGEAVSRNGRTFLLPAEIAAVIYNDPETYRAIRDTPLGQVYGPLHGDFFDVTGQSGNRSQSAVPEAYAGAVTAGRAYDLSAEGVDWQNGISHFTISLRREGVSREDYLAAAKSYLDRAAALKPHGLVALIAEDYVVEYAHFQDETAYASQLLELQAARLGAGAFDAQDRQSSRVVPQPYLETLIARDSETEAVSVTFPQEIDRELVRATGLADLADEPNLVRIKADFLKGRAGTKGSAN